MSAPSPALLYQHLADDVARMIASGTLRPGDKLPSLREMRTRRQVSLTTVTEAFRVLEDRGLIEARPQSGFYVRRRPPLPLPALPIWIAWVKISPRSAPKRPATLWSRAPVSATSRRWPRCSAAS